MLTEDGIEEKVTFDLELFKPIHTAVYFCDNKFHTEDVHFCGAECNSADGNIFQEHGPVISATGGLGADSPRSFAQQAPLACRTCRRPVEIVPQARA